MWSHAISALRKLLGFPNNSSIVRCSRTSPNIHAFFAGPVLTQYSCLLNTAFIRSGWNNQNNWSGSIRYSDTLLPKSAIFKMTASRPSVVEMNSRRMRMGGNVKDRAGDTPIVDRLTRMQGMTLPLTNVLKRTFSAARGSPTAEQCFYGKVPTSSFESHHFCRMYPLYFRESRL